MMEDLEVVSIWLGPLSCQKLTVVFHVFVKITEPSRENTYLAHVLSIHEIYINVLKSIVSYSLFVFYIIYTFTISVYGGSRRRRGSSSQARKQKGSVFPETVSKNNIHKYFKVFGGFCRRRCHRRLTRHCKTAVASIIIPFFFLLLLLINILLFVSPAF